MPTDKTFDLYARRVEKEMPESFSKPKEAKFKKYVQLVIQKIHLMQETVLSVVMNFHNLKFIIKHVKNVEH